MQLSKQAINEFKEIYKKEFGEELDDDQANQKGSDLLKLMSLIYKPIPKQPSPIFEIDDSEIIQKLKAAISLFLQNESFLLQNGVNERTVTAKLACYLQPLFGTLSVDCEYNKHGLSTKILPRECHDQYMEYVYPDIVIHKRGEKLNLVVIEVKTVDSNRVQCDEIKLQKFTHIKGEFGYKIGLHLLFNQDQPPKLIFYKDGNVVST